MLFSRRDLVNMTLPLIIQQTLAVTVGMIDTMMVSSAGEAAVSGVSLVNSLDILLINVFAALVSGGSIVVSQFLGRGDLNLVRSSAKQLIYVATAVALLITGLVLIFRVPLLDLLFGDVEPDVMSSAQDYFFFMSLSFPFLALYDSCSALFRVMGNSSLTMIVSIVMNLINVAGNAALIYGFQMGAMGAAIATLFARMVCSFIMLYLLHNKKNTVYVEHMLQYRPDGAVIRNILRIGIPNGVENSMFQLGKLLTQSLISAMGTAAIAANAVGHTMATFQYMPGQAIGLVVIAVVGRCIGAGEQEQAKKYSRILVGTTYLCLWGVVLLTFLVAEPVIGLYNLSEEGAELAHALILSRAVSAAVMWPVAFTLPNALRAASDVRFTMILSVSSMWCFRVALAYVFAQETVSIFGWSFPGLGMGVMGVWVAMYVDWIFRAVFFLIRYFSGRWLKKYRPAATSQNA